MEWNGTEAFRNLLMRLTAASKRAMREFDFAKSDISLISRRGVYSIFIMTANDIGSTSDR